MDLIDLEDDTIDAEVMDSLAVTMDNFRVRTPLCCLGRRWFVKRSILHGAVYVHVQYLS